MQGRLENQMKTEKHIEELLKELPPVVTNYYLNFSTNKEFRSCLVYIQKIKKFLMYYCEDKNIALRDVDVTQITDIDISLFLKSIETKISKTGEKEYTSFSYRKQTWSVLNSFFSFLDKKHYIKENPVCLIERPTKKDSVEHVFLQDEDLLKIKESIEKGAGSKKAVGYQNSWRERDMAIFYMFISTGMRESALCEIDMNRIDFENKTLEVTDKENKVNSYTIPSKTMRVLKKWVKKREALLDGAECDALFISNRKSRIAARSVIDIINKFSEDALGYKVSPHRLRAAFCNIMFNQTNDIEFTRKMMKHSNISTTLIYVEPNEKATNDKGASIMDGCGVL